MFRCFRNFLGKALFNILKNMTGKICRLNNYNKYEADYFQTIFYIFTVMYCLGSHILIDNLCYHVKQEKIDEGGEHNIDELQELLHFPYRVCVFYV